jgi:solute carrier family 32 (vesicular inhibitory amino acid transporter)
MRHPYKYRRAVNITYAFTFLLDAAMAVIGLLMFGDGVMDAITSNVLLTKGYPRFFAELIAVCIAIIPLTKVPLNARPIVSTIEVITGLIDPTNPTQGPSLANQIGKVAVKIFTVILFVVIAIIFPSFDRIMTLLGAVCCFSICIVLPIAFHLKLFYGEMSAGEKTMNWSLLVISSVMAIVSTAFACAPRDWLEGKS